MKPLYRFSVYMTDMSHFSDFENLLKDYFTGATVRTGSRGLFMGEIEQSAVVEYITDNAVEGEGTCQRFSDAFCKLYNQDCTFIVMDRVHGRLSTAQ